MFSLIAVADSTSREKAFDVVVVYVSLSCLCQCYMYELLHNELMIVVSYTYSEMYNLCIGILDSVSHLHLCWNRF